MTAVLERTEAASSGRPSPPKRDRSIPRGSEAMARPWRLGIIGLGLGIGLVCRLFIANGFGSLRSDALIVASTATSLLAAFGLILLAAERDRFGPTLGLLALLTAGSLGVVQWISPHFADGTLEWDNRSQALLGGLGAANGLLIAGIVALALARRRPTLTVVGALVAGVLALAVGSVLLREEWPAIFVLAIAFAAMLLAWDRAPRHEPTYDADESSPRFSRALLGLASVAFCGTALQLWISRGDDVGRPLPAIVLAGVIIAIAFVVLIGIRREIQKRQTTLSEWTSWMREIRTRDLQADFESLATSEHGGLVGDVTAEPPRPLSFPDLSGAEDLRALEIEVSQLTPPRVASTPRPSAFEELWNQTAPGERSPDVPEPSPATAVTTATSARTASPPSPARSSAEEPSAPSEPPTSTIDAPATLPPKTGLPVPDLPSDESPPKPAQQPSAAEAGAPPEPARRRRSRPSFDASDLDWFVPDDGVAAPNLPTTGGGSTPTVPDPTPAARAQTPAQVPDGAPGASHTEPLPIGLGAFSTALEHEAHTAARPALGTTDDLGTWLQATTSVPTRMLAAVETMSLASYDGLSEPLRSATVRQTASALASLSPRPTLVAHIDGPYLIVAWQHLVPNQYGELNRAILSILSEPATVADGDDAVVGLTGTLALVRPASDADLDTVIDDSIFGLIRARELAVVPRRS